MPIGRVSSIDGEALTAAVAQADQDDVRCLYLLCPVSDLLLMHAALSLGFLPYDVRVELSCALTGERPGPDGVRGAEDGDEAPLLSLARDRMRDTRFWTDQRFPRERVRALYAEWLRRGLTTPPLRRTLVVGAAEGFVTCRFDPEQGVGGIELIAVAEGRERGGMGDVLVKGANHAFAEAGLEEARVVTQAQNVAAQRLYQRNGYRTSRVDIWLHRWRGPSPPA
jgi:ribosomal protein S18 acetylase RimI-like enzyme